MDRSFFIKLPSTFEESEKIPDFVDDIKQDCGLKPDRAETFKLVLSEAVTNAITHGNNLDPEKCVEITVYVSDQALSAEVRDEGKGFDPSKQQKNPLKKEHLLDTSGRGLFLINEFADEVKFSKGGTCLHITIKRQP